MTDSATGAASEFWPFAQTGEVSQAERRWLLHYYSDPFAQTGERARAVGYPDSNSKPFRALEKRMREFVRVCGQRDAAHWALVDKQFGRKPAPGAVALRGTPLYPAAVQGTAPSPEGEEAGSAAGEPAGDGKNGALVRYDGKGTVPTRETVLLRIENMHAILERQLQEALEGRDPVLAQGAMKGCWRRSRSWRRASAPTRRPSPRPPTCRCSSASRGSRASPSSARSTGS